MAPRMSVNGKPLGRPPKKVAELTPVAPPAPSRLTRAVKQVLARYDAGGYGRRLAGWNPGSAGPNNALVNLQRIRDRSRDAVRNDWAGESTVQKWSTALIGVAITPRFNEFTGDRKKAITQLWNDFVKRADADCVLDAYGMQTLGVRAWFDGGEFFLRRRPRFTDAGYPVPMQVQLLEPEMCPLLDVDSGYVGLPVGNTIRSGIEIDKRGTRVAYWFYKQHPGDPTNLAVIDPSALVRVAASDVCHVYEPKRIGQMRGVPVLATVLPKLRNIGDYEDAVLERQKIANLFVAFISKALPTLDPNDPAMGALGSALGQVLDPDALEAAACAPGLDPPPLAPMAPGLMQELDDGQSVTFANPPEAGTTYSDYMRTSHLGPAAASGLPYELYSGDIANVSDRTLRVIINDFRRLAQQRQWQIIIPMMCQPVVEWFADAAALAGLVTVDEVDKIKRCTHAPHGWEYIHPVQDVQGKALAVLNGFTSRAQVVGERGDDIEQVDEERQADMQREVDLGLRPDPTAMPDPNNPNPPAPAPGPAPAPEPAPSPAPKGHQINARGEPTAALEAFMAAIERIKPQEPPTVNVAAPRAVSKRFLRDPVTGLLDGIEIINPEEE